MKLWIANTTKQVHTFHWRHRLGDNGVPDQGGMILRPKFGDLHKQTIPVGGQILVSGKDLDEGAIREILSQNPQIVDYKSLNREKPYIGLCYRIGPDPVEIERVLERIERNDQVRTEENKLRQTNTASQIASGIREVSNQDGAPFTGLRETDVQVAQAGNQEVNGGTPKLNDVVEVLEEGQKPSGRGRKAAS
jgi:hypothetical protein